MESDLNATAGAKSTAQAIKMDVNAYASLFLQVWTLYQLDKYNCIHVHKFLDLTMAARFNL